MNAPECGHCYGQGCVERLVEGEVVDRTCGWCKGTGLAGGSELDLEKATEVAATIRSLVDPMTGRIDNWTQDGAA